MITSYPHSCLQILASGAIFLSYSYFDHKMLLSVRTYLIPIRIDIKNNFFLTFVSLFLHPGNILCNNIIGKVVK